MVPLFEALLVRKAPSFNVVASTLVTFARIGMIALRGGISSIGKGEILCMIAAVLFAWTTIITDRVCRKHDSLSVGIVYVGIIGAVLILAGILGMRKVQGG